MTSVVKQSTTAVLLAGVIVLALASSGAKAEPFTPELEGDYEAAILAWNEGPPSACASVTREVTTGLGGADDAHIAGRATQPKPADSQLACYLLIDLSLLPRPCERWEIVRHEVGHLLGHGHSADESDWMFPVMSLTECPPVPLPPTVAAPPPQGESPAPTASELMRQRYLLQRNRCWELSASTPRQRSHCWRRSRQLSRMIGRANQANSSGPSVG